MLHWKILILYDSQHSFPLAILYSVPCLFQELELPMLKVAATEMVSGVSGESEQKLRELFDQAVVRHPLEITLSCLPFSL